MQAAFALIGISYADNRSPGRGVNGLHCGTASSGKCELLEVGAVVFSRHERSMFGEWSLGFSRRERFARSLSFKKEREDETMTRFLGRYGRSVVLLGLIGAACVYNLRMAGATCPVSCWSSYCIGRVEWTSCNPCKPLPRYYWFCADKVAVIGYCTCSWPAAAHINLPPEVCGTQYACGTTPCPCWVSASPLPCHVGPWGNISGLTEPTGKVLQIPKGGCERLYF
jgi:hypothetical protein